MGPTGKTALDFFFCTNNRVGQEIARQERNERLSSEELDVYP
jgi:hypothetical protein